MQVSGRCAVVYLCAVLNVADDSGDHQFSLGIQLVEHTERIFAAALGFVLGPDECNFTIQPATTREVEEGRIATSLAQRPSPAPPGASRGM